MSSENLPRATKIRKEFNKRKASSIDTNRIRSDLKSSELVRRISEKLNAPMKSVIVITEQNRRFNHILHSCTDLFFKYDEDLNSALSGTAFRRFYKSKRYWTISDKSVTPEIIDMIFNGKYKYVVDFSNSLYIDVNVFKSNEEDLKNIEVAEAHPEKPDTKDVETPIETTKIKTGTSKTKPVNVELPKKIIETLDSDAYESEMTTIRRGYLPEL